MDLIGRLRGWTVARPRVLLVDAPGDEAFRWSVEADIERRGWSHALSPADTDLLVVLGSPGPELAAAVDVLWNQVPEPRHRMDLHRPDGEAALDEGQAALVRRASSRVDADDRPLPASLLGADDDAGHEGMGHGGMDHGGDVAGLPMASTGPDRDGLELDVLNMSLGPVLPGWPTGLVLRAQLQGDVLASAELSWLDADAARTDVPDLDPQRVALDRLARFLVVAGWPAAARAARRARDGLGADGPDRLREAQRLAEAVARRVRRSRTLAWTATGIGEPAPDGGPGAGVVARLRHWCAVASAERRDLLPEPSLDAVAAAVEGTEIGSARLIVACFDLDPVAVIPRPGAARA